jgi:hypothetical protein
VIFYRRIFLDFLDGRVDFDDESSFECLISSFPRCRSLLYALTELICAYLERSVLRPAFFGLCSKQMDVPFFNDKSTQFPNNIKTKRGKCLDLKTKLQSAVDNVDSMLPDLICDQKWASICAGIPSHIFPDLHAFLHMEGLLLINSINITIGRILDSTSNILKYIKNETDMTFDVSSDAGHLSVGIVPLSWDEYASNVFVQYSDFLSLIQSQKKVFDLVCLQLESLSEIIESEDQRLIVLSAGVAIRSFSAYVVPNFATHLSSLNQDMMQLLGKNNHLSSIQNWMMHSSDVDAELLFWTPKQRFSNHLRREVMSPSALYFNSIKEFVRDTLNAEVDEELLNMDKGVQSSFPIL